MTISITLDPETEHAIERKAKRLGITVSEYVNRLAQKSARPRLRQNTTPSKPAEITSAERLSGIIERADPVELKANGITLAKYPAKTGADLLRNLDEAGITGVFGDPDVDSPELARQFREQAQTRDWS